VIREAQKRFADDSRTEFERWAEAAKHRRVVDAALTAPWIEKVPLSDRLRLSLEALKDRPIRPAPVRDLPSQQQPGPPIFQMQPGLNILAPPYDFGVNVALGSNAPSVQVSLGTGRFTVNATAPADTNTFGSAGIGLFLVPSSPGRTLSIRPYFEYAYSYYCESHGSPTAHCFGVVSANVSGRRTDGSSLPLMSRNAQLWSAGSDAWDDAHGGDGGVWWPPDCTLTASGFDFYTLSYICQAGADSGSFAWWWSVAGVEFTCRVPFLVVEET
jgi:hypothetical protein